jgi:hypothetical protein
MKKKQLLILFPDVHLAYAPTVINLLDLLEEWFDVSVITVDNTICTQKLERPNVQYVRIPEPVVRTARMLQAMLARFRVRVDTFKPLRAVAVLCRVLGMRPDVIIGVDPIGLWAAQTAFRRGHLVSLEIDMREWFLPLLRKRLMQSVLIQSEDRYRLMFPKADVAKFIVQNAPVYQPFPAPDSVPSGLVYCGSSVSYLGFDFCLDYVRTVTNAESVTIQGMIFDHVREELQTKYETHVLNGSLVLNDDYVDRQDLARYLSRFLAGLCFYDLRFVPKGKRDNYLTAPSGKLFNYYAAGVPVIGLNIPGLRSVRDFDAGVLLDEVTPQAIHDAVKVVRMRYFDFRRNCFRAAEHFSFDKAIIDYRKFLLADAEHPRCHGNLQRAESLTRRST